jgi:hypothetical protein
MNGKRWRLSSRLFSGPAAFRLFVDLGQPLRPLLRNLRGAV